MRLLVDTHCWLWQLSEPERLPETIRRLITDRSHEVYLSTACMWEIVIKQRLGKLTLPEDVGTFIPSRMDDMGHIALPIIQAHVLQLSSLPPHHKDPFDRILVAQAVAEGMKLITADTQLKRYDVDLLWAGS